jgi:serine/threonine protein kinase
LKSIEKNADHADKLFMLLNNQVLELLQGGSLFGLLHDDQRELTERRQIKLWLDVCLGVQYLHANNVVHRDLKVRSLESLS